MSAIKNHLLPDSSLVCGILLCLVILGVKFYFAPGPKESGTDIGPNQSSIISQLTDEYLERLDQDRER